MEQIAKISFTAAIQVHTLYGGQHLGTYDNTMILFKSKPTRSHIEWDVITQDLHTCIGIDHDENLNVSDYDGIITMPKEAIELLQQNGYTYDE